MWFIKITAADGSFFTYEINGSRKDRKADVLEKVYGSHGRALYTGEETVPLGAHIEIKWKDI